MRIKVAGHLTKKVQQAFPNWVYVYDETKAIKTGERQWGLHFFRNFSYQKGRVNRSKFHYGHEFGALGLLCQTSTGWQLFPVWARLMVPQTCRDKSDAVLKTHLFPDRSGSYYFLIVGSQGEKCLRWFKVMDIISCVVRSLMPSSIVYRNSRNIASVAVRENMETAWIFAGCGIRLWI